jgi:hypothetical protein
LTLAPIAPPARRTTFSLPPLPSCRRGAHASPAGTAHVAWCVRRARSAGRRACFAPSVFFFFFFGCEEPAAPPRRRAPTSSSLPSS